MPYITVNNSKIFYEDQGARAEPIVFAHGLMFSSRMFQAQIAVLKKQHRCVAFDFRAHGKSPANDRGYSMEELAEDTAEFIKTLNCGPCHFVGLSMGCYVGLRLAITCSELLKSLTLLGASAEAQPKFTAFLFRYMNRIANCGPKRKELMITFIIYLMFSNKYRKDKARSKDLESWKKEMIVNYEFKAVQGVVDRTSVYDKLGYIKIPTLVITGGKDKINPPKLGERIQAAIDRAKSVRIPGAGHIASIEEPDEVSQLIKEHLDQI